MMICEASHPLNPARPLSLQMNIMCQRHLFTFWHALFFIIIIIVAVGGHNNARSEAKEIKCLRKETQALLEFKSGISDGNGILSSWINGTDCCEWVGVGCGNRTYHVVSLVLSGLAVSSESKMISPSLLKLNELYHLDLSFGKFEGSQIPGFFGSLAKLIYLNLGHCSFAGMMPHSLQNLSMLQFLDLSYNALEGSIPDSIGNLKHISYLDLSNNHLGGSIPRGLLGNLTSLSHLDLSNNQLQLIEFPDQLSLTRLVVLSLARNKLQGDSTHLLMQLWNSTLLEQIDLSENALFGSLPNMSGFQRLVELRLNDNRLNESIGEESFRLPSLGILDLSENELVGRIPDLSSCSSLRELRLTDNMFNDTLAESIGSLSSLHGLFLGSNRLEGLVSEAHFFNLSNLETLDLSFNSNLTLRINSSWNPPFQLNTVLLSNCRLGPHFPGWLRKQAHITSLDISNAAILDTIPKWFWNNTPQAPILYLNMSHNQIYGTLPDLSSLRTGSLDLSFNQFSGTLPSLPSYADEMYLSHNRFVGTVANICKAVPTYILDFSHNQLSGQISPECFTNFTSLFYLNLGDNYLSGEIQANHSECRLLSLHLRNNSFTGYIPESLGSCRELIALDLQENKFYGTIPGWLGESTPNLVILSFKANKLHGSVPPSLCRLHKLQLFDISMNHISGAIPKCVNNFTALRSKVESNLGASGLVDLTKARNGTIFVDASNLLWKGQIVEYSNTLWLLKAMDFSSNNLSGEIPQEVTSLVELVGLNLSRNNLIGSIPRNIGELKLLDFVDLAHNHLSGNIPPTLSQLSHLGMLDLSFNNLSGEIPRATHMDTFDAASYVGNAGLCGPPLVSRPCPEDVETPKKPKFVDGGTNKTEEHKKKNMFKTREFYIGIVFGFILFFWGVFGTLYFSKRWNLAMVKMFTAVDNWLYVKIRVVYVQRYYYEDEE